MDVRFGSENMSPNLPHQHPRQMSIREYPEHYYYIDMYSNSADSMFILDEDGTVVDCNGATLRMLDCRGRSDLIGSVVLDRLSNEYGVLGEDKKASKNFVSMSENEACGLCVLLLIRWQNFSLPLAFVSLDTPPPPSPLVDPLFLPGPRPLSVRSKHGRL